MLKSKSIMLFMFLIFAVVAVYLGGRSYIGLPNAERVVTINGSFVLVDQSELKARVKDLSERIESSEEFISSISELLSRQSYISRHTVRLSWPNNVDISIEEISPIARLPGNQLLDQGCRLHKSERAFHFTNLVSFDYTDIDEATACSRIKDIARHANANDVDIITLLSNGDYQVRYKGLVYKIKGNNVALQLRRIEQTHEMIYAAGYEPVYVDLRYQSGGAIGLVI